MLGRISWWEGLLREFFVGWRLEVKFLGRELRVENLFLFWYKERGRVGVGSVKDNFFDCLIFFDLF